MDMSTAQIAQELKKINGRFDQLEERYDKRFEEHNERFDFLAKKLLEHDKQFELLTTRLLKHEDQSEELKAVIKDNHREVLDRSDEIIAKLTLLDIERQSANASIRRLEDKVEKLGGY